MENEIWKLKKKKPGNDKPEEIWKGKIHHVINTETKKMKL